jgi:hypothetical protein
MPARLPQLIQGRVKENLENNNFSQVNMRQSAASIQVVQKFQTASPDITL